MDSMNPSEIVGFTRLSNLVPYILLWVISASKAECKYQEYSRFNVF
ncbi:MAG: hypothetical protein ACOXZV_11125 [Bacteroidales bacterium]|jgi:hypothetical protein